MAKPLSCEEVDDLLPIASLGALPSDDGRELTRHLAGCARCRELGAQYSLVADALPYGLEQLKPPDRLRRNLMGQVYADSDSAPRHSTPLWRRIWDRVPAGRGFTISGGLAATAAVVLIAGGLNGRINSPTPPRTVAYNVSGTTAQSGATGTLVYDSIQSRAVLTVQGLPKLPSQPATATSVYEVWLIPAHGDPVPASFLTLQPDGHTWTAVLLGDVSHYGTIAATIEPAGGTSHPTGTEVISGSLAA